MNSYRRACSGFFASLGFAALMAAVLIGYPANVYAEDDPCLYCDNYCSRGVGHCTGLCDMCPCGCGPMVAFDCPCA